MLKVRCLRGADRCLLLFEQRLVRVRFDLHQQVAFLHRFAVFDWKFDDFARYFRRDFYFCFGLNFSGRGDRLQNRFAHCRFCCDRNWLLAFASDDPTDDQQQYQANRTENDVTPPPQTPFLGLLRGNRRGGQGLMHKMLVGMGDGNYLTLDPGKANAFTASIVRCSTRHSGFNKPRAPAFQAPFLNLLDRPCSMLGNQGFRIGRSVFQRRQIGQIAHVPQGDANIAQKTASLDSFYRRVSEKHCKFGII